MKRLLLIVLPLLLIVGCSKPIEDSTLIKKDGLMYSPDSDKPYTGEVFRNYSSGEKLYQGTYEDGQLVDFSYLKKDGSLKEPINYETTLIERDDVYYTKDTNIPYSGPVFSLYDNGMKKYEGTIKDGKKEGLWTGWYDNGQKKIEKTFKDGIEEGLQTSWYETGQKESERTYKDWKEDGLWTRWYENGQKYYERTYKDGKKDGLWTGWYETGQKKMEENYKNDKLNGLWTSWYETGQKKSEGTYKNGKKDGLWTNWYKNGQKESERTYKDGWDTRWITD